jgi:hypothetical protein
MRCRFIAKAGLIESEEVVGGINASVDVLARHLQDGEMVYG